MVWDLRDANLCISRPHGAWTLPEATSGVHQESVLWGSSKARGPLLPLGPFPFNCLTQLLQLPSVAGGWSEDPQGWGSLCWGPRQPVTPAPQVRAPRLRDVGESILGQTGSSGEALPTPLVNTGH